MEHQIKKIKDYIKDGAPQFDVLERYGVGENVDIQIEAASPGLEMSFKEIISPKSAHHAVIKKVKRIKDNKVFGIYSYVLADGTSSFIMQFSEDLVNCYVVEAYEKNPIKKQVPINDIEFDGGEEFSETSIDIGDDDCFEQDPIDEW